MTTRHSASRGRAAGVGGGVFVNLPVLNERACIGALLDDITRELRGVDHVVCIVDDGSTDGTVEIIEEHNAREGNVKLIRGRKRGAGCERGNALRRALRWGVENTRCERFVEMDGDYSHDPRELREGLALLDRHDVVIGSKYRRGSTQTPREPLRKGVSLAATTMLRAMFDIPVTDFTNGYRFYNRACAEALAAFETRYASPAYLMEALALWAHLGFRIGDFPTRYHGREMGRSKVVAADFVRGFAALFEIKLRFVRLARRERRVRGRGTVRAEGRRRGPGRRQTACTRPRT